MAYRIAPSQSPTPSKATARVKSGDYLSWLHELPCVITGQRLVEAAHVSFENRLLGAPGRGKGAKVSDRWALPLLPEMHRAQHAMNEREFWRQHGIDPHLICLTLWGLWCERKDDATPIAEAMILARKTGRVVRREGEE